MRILHLTLYREYFDQILAGRKKEEYREDKPYWQKRLLNTDGGPKRFDMVEFRNGYSHKSRIVRLEWKGVSRDCGRITIHLGKIISAVLQKTPDFQNKNKGVRK